MNGGRSVFERHARLTILTLLVLSVVAADLLFTAAYRRLAPPPGPNPLRAPSDIYHHGLRPRASVDDERWGPRVAAYRTNSLGFRDRSVREVALRPSGRRILFIGDSFTEGVGVAWDDSFVGRVDTALAARGVEVLNAAAVSYCPIIYRRKVKHLLEDVGLRFDELVVYIDIGDIDDQVTYRLDEQGRVVPRPVRWLQEQGANHRFGGRGYYRFPQAKKVLDRHSLLWSHVYAGVERLFPMEGNRAALWTVDDDLFKAYGREGLETSRKDLDGLRDLARQHGVALTVAVYPWPDQVIHDDRESKQVVFWKRWAEENGVGFVNHFPDIVGVDGALGRFYIRGDVHWTEEGHRVIAEGFLRHYAQR